MLNRYFVTICNIPWTICHRDLEKYFAAFSNIRHAKVIFDSNGISTGYGFVEFKERLDMQIALNRTHFLEDNKIIIIKGIAFEYHKAIEETLKIYFSDSFFNEYKKQASMDHNLLDKCFEHQNK